MDRENEFNMEKSSKINFDADTHTYTNENGEILISVSTLIGLYSQPFDSNGEILKRCARLKKISQAELKAEWDKERDEATIRGNSFHSQAEHWAKTGVIDEKGDYNDVIKQLAAINFKGKLLSEQIVYSNNLKIAGTIDLIEDLDDDFIKLYDFKTNKQLKTKGYFNKITREYTRMLYPLCHMDDCNWNHYCLQLSGYQILEEEDGKIVIDRELIYVNPKTRKLERFEVPDLRDEFRSMIDHYLSLKI